MSKTRIDFDKNLFAGVFEGQSCLLLCKGSLANLMALLPPIPGLPCKQGANRAYVLRQKINICGTEIACLDGHIRDVVRLLALSRQVSLTYAICREFHFWTTFERSRSGCRKVLLFGERRGNGFHRKFRLHPAS